MGELPTKKSVVKIRRDGQTITHTIEVYLRNSAGAIATAKVLLDECERREKAPQEYDTRQLRRAANPSCRSAHV